MRKERGTGGILRGLIIIIDPPKVEERGKNENVLLGNASAIEVIR